MEITELRIDLPAPRYHANDTRSALLACYSLEFDEEFVIHSVKLIQGKTNPFLAMPNERKHDHCPACRAKNHLLANYCNNCGKGLTKDRHTILLADGEQRSSRLYNDLAHPITCDLREYLLDECLDAYNKEKTKPGTILPLHRNDETRRTG